MDSSWMNPWGTPRLTTVCFMNGLLPTVVEAMVSPWNTPRHVPWLGAGLGLVLGFLNGKVPWDARPL